MEIEASWSLFNPDPDDPVWRIGRPTDEDLSSASLEQRELWFRLNKKIVDIHSAWASLELQLAVLLASVLRIRIVQATAVLSSLQANKPKRDLIENCSSVSLSSEETRRKISRILNRVSRAATKRNQFAHGVATFHQRYPSHITIQLVSPDGRPALTHYLAYPENELVKVEMQILAISGTINELAPKIWRARRQASFDTLGKKQSGDLIFFANHRRPPREKPDSQPPSSREKRPKKLSSAQKRALRQKAQSEPPSD